LASSYLNIVSFLNGGLVWERAGLGRVGPRGIGPRGELSEDARTKLGGVRFTCAAGVAVTEFAAGPGVVPVELGVADGGGGDD